MRKKSVFLFVFYYAIVVLNITFYINLSAQGIGVNNTGKEADVSALLEIGNGTSDTKGLLIPRVALISTTDGATIATPATSLLVYNTNESITGGAGSGYYYNSGTAVSPVWVRLISGTAVTSVTGTPPISVATSTTTPAISVATNSQLSDGVVLAGGSNNSMVWKTDASGNPAWRADANSEGTVTSIATGTGLTGGTITNTGTVSLSTPVSIENGGTNTSTATPLAGAVAYGTGTAYDFSSTGVAGQVLVSNGSSAPNWTNHLTNLDAPTAAADAATKAYVDAAGGSQLNVYKSDGTTLLGPLAYASFPSYNLGTLTHCSGWGYWLSTGGIHHMQEGECADSYSNITIIYTSAGCTGSSYIESGCTSYVTDGVMWARGSCGNYGNNTINSTRTNGVCTDIAPTSKFCSGYASNNGTPFCGTTGACITK
ncbi:MAG: hypothetical protein HGB12_07955 [Bacteroidetes bacterium]|nr:hypothetical protein [Bacteroidota bacterium]